MQTIYAADVFARLPKRTADSNKGSFGRVAAVAGSLQYRGAAALCYAVGGLGSVGGEGGGGDTP